MGPPTRPSARPARVAGLVVATLALASSSGCYFFPRDTTGTADAVYLATEWKLRGPSTFRTKGVPGSPHARPVFGLRNDGAVPHELRLFSVAGLTRGQRRDVVARLRSTGRPPEGGLRSGGIAALAPGKAASSTQLLSAGHYLLACLLVDDQGQTHAQRGMVMEVRVV